MTAAATTHATGLESAAEALRQAERILITTHINPDGDAAGSALGLAHILNAAGKAAQVVSQDGAGRRYRFLPGADQILTSASGTYDLGVAVDCANPSRTGTVKNALLACPHVLRIDHHAVGHAFGDIQYVDPTAAAVGEMIVRLADCLQDSLPSGKVMPPQAAECLLASIVEDTGCFQFETVTPHTLQICARLVEAGASLHRVVQNIFWMNEPGAARLQACCIERMTLECGGRLAWTVASLADFAEFGAVEEDADEVVHKLLAIRGVEAGLLLREDTADYRVSLRSRANVNVAEIAREFGGGGHAHAAGCRLPKSAASLRALISAIARRLAA